MATTIVTPEVPVAETAEEKYKRLYETPQPTETTLSTSTQTPPPVDEAALTAKLQATIQGELANFKASLHPKPEEPKLSPWFERLRQGDFEGAEQDMTNRVKAAVTQEAASKAVQEAVEMMKVQIEVDRFLTSLRGQNPDLVPMEKYITAPVQHRMEVLKAEGKIKSSSDFVREYQTSVNEEVKNIREILLQQRAVGNREAQVRQREVLNASTLNPQAVNSTREAPSNEPPTETIDDYFTRRKGIEQLRRGMNPTN
jgi:hypothetical protein